MDGAFPESGPGRDHRRRDLSFSYVSSETADKKFLLRLLLLLLLLPLTISRTLSWQWLHLPCRRCLHRRGAWRRRSAPPSLRSPCLASVTSSSRIGSGVGEAKNLQSFFALAPLTPLLSPYAPVQDRYDDRNGGNDGIFRTLPGRRNNAGMAYIELV